MIFKTCAIFCVLLAVVNFVHSLDYCSSAVLKGCGTKLPHVACPKPTGFPVSAACKNPQQVTFTAAQKQLMIDAHNIKRNLVASGQASTGSSPLPSATNMQAVTWNTDSEYLAGLNTLQCTMNHDACRYTTMYNGQNLFISMSSANDQATDDVIQQAVDEWYSEITSMDLTQISKFTGVNFQDFGHFSQLVWGPTAQIGCAMSTWFDGDWYNYLVACNYAVGGNMKGSPVYNAGAAASACANGVSTAYKSLCK